MLKSENTFINLGLNSHIIDMLKDIGYKEPLPIQKKCIPYLLNGYDVLGMAHTGSGKTAAFLLPLLQGIDIEHSFVQGLVVAPTRELAIQIGQVCINFAKYMQKINITTLYGGQSYIVQFKALKEKPHIIIGTPGRLLDHLDKGTTNISKLKTLIIDEADEMLRMGFIEDIERIVEKITVKHQTALFSATLPISIRRISHRFMSNPKEVYINSDMYIRSEIKQRYWLVNGIPKHEALMRFLETEDFDAAIVFVRTKYETLKIAEILGRFGYNSAALNGDMNQIIRHQTISRLQYGKLDILIATDIAARGLDIHRISLVINYDIPNNYDDYVHRIGRTGRAGRIGKSLLFVERQEYRLLNNIKYKTKYNILEVQYPTSKALIEHRLLQLTDKIVHQLNSKDMNVYKSLLTRIKLNHDLTIENLAAVLLKMAQGNRPLVLPSDPVIKHRLLDKNHRLNNFDQQSKKYHRKINDNITKRNNDLKCNLDKINSANVSIYQISLGLNDGVKIRHIIKAMSNQMNLYRFNISNIRIFDSYSIIEVSQNKSRYNISSDFKLSRVRIFNKLMNIKFLGHIIS